MYYIKLIIFVHTCKLYEQTRSKLLKNTWADNNDIFITDNENSELNNFIYIGPNGILKFAIMLHITQLC